MEKLIAAILDSYIEKHGTTDIDNVKLTESINHVISEMKTHELKSYQLILESKDTDAQINRFGELGQEIDRLKAQLKNLQTEFKTIEKDIRPLLDVADGLEKRHLETEKYLITIKKKGYAKTNVKYKEAFTLALSKVNKQTRRILNEALEASTTTSQVASQIAVQKNEGIFSTVLSKISKFINKIKRHFKGMDKDIDVLKRLSRL